MIKVLSPTDCVLWLDFGGILHGSGATIHRKGPSPRPELPGQ